MVLFDFLYRVPATTDGQRRLEPAVNENTVYSHTKTEGPMRGTVRTRCDYAFRCRPTAILIIVNGTTRFGSPTNRAKCNLVS